MLGLAFEICSLLKAVEETLKSFQQENGLTFHEDIQREKYYWALGSLEYRFLSTAIHVDPFMTDTYMMLKIEVHDERESILSKNDSYYKNNPRYKEVSVIDFLFGGKTSLRLLVIDEISEIASKVKESLRGAHQELWAT